MRCRRHVADECKNVSNHSEWRATVQVDSYAKPEFGTDEVGDVMLIYVNGILVYQWRCHRSFCFHIQYLDSMLSLCVRNMYKLIDVL